MTISIRLLAGTALAAALATGAGAAEPVIVAHRGASGYLPEHTLEAKALAYGLGADYIEQDVVLSQDGVPVVLHDIHIDTVTDVAKRFPERARADGRYYAIDFALAELKTLTVNERIDLKTGQPVFADRFPLARSRFEIPTLAEEIELVQGLNRSTGRAVGIYPEIKHPAWHRAEGQDIARIVIETLARHGYDGEDDLAYLQCFDWAETRRIRAELGYQGRLVQLIGLNDWADAAGTDYDALLTEAGLAEVAAVADGIGPRLEYVVAGADAAGAPQLTDLVETAHRLGLAVHPFTFRADALPKFAPSFDWLVETVVVQAGADGLFTDHPDRARAALAGQDH
jgi:glycerophosphoryl diester phosphodiesterase